MTKKYTIEVTEKQAYVMRDALEVLSRLQIGQVWAATDNLPSDSNKVRDWDMQKALEAAYAPFEPASHKHNDASEIAWDLYTVIRHHLAWDNNPQGGIGVSFDSPMQHGSEPLADIKAANDE